MSDPAPTDRDETAAAPTGDGGFADVVAEIEAETERRRAAGEYPPELLERLDAEFDRFAPLSYRRTGLEGAIRAVESAAFVNVDAPVDSTRRSARTVKSAVKRGTAWYQLHLARQVTALGIQMTRPLRMLAERTGQLDERVAALEAAVGQTSIAVTHELAALTGGPLGDDVVAATVGLLSGRTGRVLHAGADDPGVVAALVGAGVDAYGVDPHGGGGLELEIRAERPLDHLRSLAPDVLDGVVMTGTIDTAPVNTRVELCRLAVDRTTPGGRIVLVSADPEGWAQRVGPVVADLVARPPFRTETWMHLLERHGGRAPHLEATLDGVRVIVASSS